MIHFQLDLSGGRNSEYSSAMYFEWSHATKPIEFPKFKLFHYFFLISNYYLEPTLNIDSAMLLKLLPLIVTDRSFSGREPNISFRRSVVGGVFGSVRPIFAIASNETSCCVRAGGGDSIQSSRKLSASSNKAGILNVGILKHGEIFSDRRDFRGFKAAN